MVKRMGTGADTSETIGARIPLKEMIVDSEYQGHVNEILVEKISKNWKDSAAGAIILNLREDNTYAVLDGQHRVLAAQKRGVTELNALVFIGKSRQEEAELFVQLNFKHNVRPFDRFRANLMAGKIVEKNIVAILRELGLKLSEHPNKTNEGGVRCIVALKNIYELHGGPHLKTVMGVLQAAFAQYPDKGKAYGDEAVKGTSQFIFRYPEADISKLIQRMSVYAPTTIQGIAVTKIDPGQNKWVGWGRALTGIYNYGVRSAHPNYLPSDRWNKTIYSPAGLLAQNKVKTGPQNIEHLKKYQFTAMTAAAKAKSTKKSTKKAK